MIYRFACERETINPRNDKSRTVVSAFKKNRESGPINVSVTHREGRDRNFQGRASCRDGTSVLNPITSADDHRQRWPVAGGQSRSPVRQRPHPRGTPSPMSAFSSAAFLAAICSLSGSELTPCCVWLVVNPTASVCTNWRRHSRSWSTANPPPRAALQDGDHLTLGGADVIVHVKPAANPSVSLPANLEVLRTQMQQQAQRFREEVVAFEQQRQAFLKQQHERAAELERQAAGSAGTAQRSGERSGGLGISAARKWSRKLPRRRPISSSTTEALSERSGTEPAIPSRRAGPRTWKNNGWSWRPPDKS